MPFWSEKLSVSIQQAEAFSISFCTVRAIQFSMPSIWSEDLRNQSLLVRKRKLERLIKSAKIGDLLYGHHVERRGVKLFETIREQNLEGSSVSGRIQFIWRRRYAVG